MGFVNRKNKNLGLILSSTTYRLCWHWSACLSFIFLIYKTEMKIGLTHRTVAGHVAVEQLAEQTELLLLSRSMCNTYPDSRQTAIQLISPQAPPEELEPRRVTIGSGWQSLNPSKLVLERLLLAGCMALWLLSSVKKKKMKGEKKIPKVKREGWRSALPRALSK